MWLATNPSESYIETVRGIYLSDIESLSGVGRINDWASEKTHGKIPRVMDELPPDPLMVLANAIYFKGTWVIQFDPEDTVPSDFRKNPTESVETDFMNMENILNYTHMDGVKILKMPYEGDRLSMLVMLPDDADGIAELEGRLSVELLEEWRQNLHPRPVIVSMPKFTMSTTYGLIEPLTNLGMPNAFYSDDGEAPNFSGIFLNGFISSATQNAFVNVNEEGTEAAAVTVIGGSDESAPPPTPLFIADHPFIFMIQDDESGMILFMGRMSAP